MIESDRSISFESRYQRFAWFVLAFNVLVILWGAFVRATGSGAGCGGNWPLCQGDVFPLSATAETLIEYTHRITSGLALLLTLILTFISRKFPAGARVRKAALASGVFIVIEALIGAGLVLLDLVGGNTSVMRAIASAIHLSNTYLLLAALAFTAIWASTNRATYRSPGRKGWGLIVLALVGLIVVGASGAITALGDTLFPARDLAAGVAEELEGTSHFLVRLRVIHPLVAIVVGAYILFGLRFQLFVQEANVKDRIRTAVTVLIASQWVAGAVNVLLLAPIWMQIVHLLIADLIWIAFIIYLEHRLYPASENHRSTSV
jgi:cytochrome c oxidase assembly protein subunit 15